MRRRRAILAGLLLMATGAAYAQLEPEIRLSRVPGQPHAVQLSWEALTSVHVFEVWRHDGPRDLVSSGVLLTTTDQPGHLDDPAPSPSFYRVLANCVDDWYEENDTLDDAYELLWDIFDEDLALCEGDEDWFRGVCYSGRQVLSEVYFDPSYGEIEVKLYDLAAPGSPVADAVETTRGRLELRYTCPADGWYVFRVYHPTGGEQGYNGTFWFPPPPCYDDDNEPNDSAALATPGLPGNPHDNGSLCEGDEDWFASQATAGQTLQARVWACVTDIPVGGYTVEILDTDAFTVLVQCDDWGGDCRVWTEITSDGTYFVRVIQWGGETNYYCIDQDTW